MPAAKPILRDASPLREVTTLANDTPAPSLVMVADPSGPAAEAVRALRTRLQSEHIQLGRRALAVCAASANVGCTFLATNLAVSLAQIGIKTLLVDANLRNPSVHTYFGAPEPTQGLAACLADSDLALDECVSRDVEPGLDVLFAGKSVGRPQELLAGSRFPQIMNACLRDYEMTIVDTAPANSSSDCLLVTNAVSFALIVARKHQSLVSDIRTLSGQIRSERARVLGTVLNAF
jgi:capsular exopolysaccharide synthesis family protein